MQFGDEGKGSFVDYIASAQNIRQIVRYNGGSQASHTVIIPQGVLHKFSQLGSAMFLDDCKTYITCNMVVNPLNLAEEVIQFAGKTKQKPQSVLDRIVIDENCYIVTPYHKLINQAREIVEGDKRRGSVGTGVSEVRRILRKEKIGIQMKDLHDRASSLKALSKLFDYAKNFCEVNKNTLTAQMPESVRENLESGIHYLLDSENIACVCEEYQSMLKYNSLNISHDVCACIDVENGIVFEGAQGIHIDETYGFKPNTTILDTTINYALVLCKKLKVEKITKIGVAKAVTSRHGIGVFPTEAIELNDAIKDANQESSYWNGSIRFGWFDAVLLRYAQSINNVDELFISSIDKLDSFAIIRICDSYQYFGEINDEFNRAFEYEINGGYACISNIKENTKNISRYLSQCFPVYRDIRGWECDTTQTTEVSALPQNCRNYIAEIERLTNIKVSIISVGATRNEKVAM